MAESQRGTSSADPKEKKSLLDEEIGNEFLSSWKSMSVTEDDAMDFSFDTISNGNKKKFNFDKLDMDFNLDSDFGKFSSFKVDMPDLDFSCPSEKTAKLKDRSEEQSSSGNHQGKQDRFTFSFDFNDLDGFKLDSSLTKGEKTSNKNLDRKGAASGRSECQRSKTQSQLAEGIGALDDSITTTLPVLEGMATPKVETKVGGAPACKSINDACTSKYATFGNSMSHGARTSPEKTITTNAEETYGQSHLSEEAMSAEPHTRETMQNRPVQSVSENDSTRDTVSDIQTEVCSPSTKVNMCSHWEQNDNHKTIAGVESNNENSQCKNSSPPHVTEFESDKAESKKSGSNSSTENMDETKPAQGDLDFEYSFTPSLSRKTPHDTRASRDIPNSDSKLLLVPSTSEPAVDKLSPTKEKEAGGIHSKFFRRSEESGPQLHQPSSTLAEVSFSNKKISTMPLCPTNEKREDFNANDTQIGSRVIGNSKSLSRELTKGEPVLLGSEENVKRLSNICELAVDKLTPTKENEAGGIHSKFVGRSEETRPQLHQPSSTLAEVSFSSKKISTMPLCPTNEKREEFNGNDTQIGSRLFGHSKSLSRELTKGELVLLGSEENVKRLSNIGEGFKTDGVHNGRKLVDNSRPHDKEITKGGSVMLGMEENTGFQVIPFSSTEKTAKSSTQTSVNPKLVQSIWNSKVLSVEGLKTGKRTTDLSRLNNSRTVATNKDPSNSTLQRESNSLRNSEQNMDGLGNSATKITCPVGITEKPMPLISSLKRKTFEASNSNLVPLNPPKRLFESPSESSNFKEPSEKFVEKVCNDENLVESKTQNVIYNRPDYELEIPQEVTMTEPITPLVMENDGNVEKAEAYTKELEDICNMLKKKHEEAKEILVRAVVNNNKLLMLNHPIYEQKIRMVQQFAAKLASNELQA